jgi:hypothetical protein
MLLLLPSCGSGASSPEDAAKEYAQAVLSKDIGAMADILVGDVDEDMIDDYMIGMLDMYKENRSYSYTAALEQTFGTSKSSSVIKQAKELYMQSDSELLEYKLLGYSIEIETITGSTYQGADALNIINEYAEEVADFIEDALDSDAAPGAAELGRAMVFDVPDSPQVVVVNVSLIVRDAYGNVEDSGGLRVYTVKDGSGWKVLDDELPLPSYAYALVRKINNSIDY